MAGLPPALLEPPPAVKKLSSSPLKLIAVPWRQARALNAPTPPYTDNCPQTRTVCNLHSRPSSSVRQQAVSGCAWHHAAQAPELPALGDWRMVRPSQCMPVCQGPAPPAPPAPPPGAQN